MTYEQRIEQHDGKRAILKTWEEQPMEVFQRERDYIRGLKARIVQYRNYIKNHSLIEDLNIS